MGKRGPPKTPTVILKQRGSWLANTRTNEPQFEDGIPECPDWLRPEAKEAWEQLVPRLARVPGLLKAVDEAVLVVYCQTWAKWRECEDFLAKHGVVYPTKNRRGDVTGFVQYPHVNTAIKLQEQLYKIGKEFGMTASARAGLTVSDAAPIDTSADPNNIIRLALARAN